MSLYVTRPSPSQSISRVKSFFGLSATGNGKRSEIDLAGDLEDLRQDERALPEFESPELEEFGGRTRLDDGYGSREDEEDLSSYRGRQANAREDPDYDDRRERLLDVLVSVDLLLQVLENHFV